jgi:tRNA pseudouridine38-40 synthase
VSLLASSSSCGLCSNVLFRFHVFFHHIDHFRTHSFLWVTASGIPAAKPTLWKGELAGALVGADSEDEADVGNEEG